MRCSRRQNQVDPRAVIRLVQHPGPRLPPRRPAQAAHLVRDRGRRRALRVRREVPGRAARAAGRPAPRPTRGASRRPETPLNYPLYFRPMKLLAVRDCCAGRRRVRWPRCPPRWRRPRRRPTVYTIELIVFRNLSGAGGPEDWSAKAVARGPDKPDSPVTGRFVQAVPAVAVPAQRRRGAAAQHH